MYIISATCVFFKSNSRNRFIWQSVSTSPGYPQFNLFSFQIYTRFNLRSIPSLISFHFRSITAMWWWSRTTSMSRSSLTGSEIKTFSILSFAFKISYSSYPSAIMIIMITIRTESQRHMTLVETPTMLRTWDTPCTEPFLSFHCEQIHHCTIGNTFLSHFPISTNHFFQMQNKNWRSAQIKKLKKTN